MTVSERVFAANDNASTPGGQRGRRGQSAIVFLRDIAIIVVVAIVISFLVKTFLIRSFYIPSSSMEQTLLIDDRILVNQLVPGLTPIERGDVVVFRDPGGWLDPQPPPEQNPILGFFDSALSFIGLTSPDSNEHLIKRVVGLPGDTVACCDNLGQMVVSGVPIDEPYVHLSDGSARVSRDDFDIVVPRGSLWVMGDNRNNSADSRLNRDGPGNGFVPIDTVVGRAILVSWTIDRWRVLDNHPDVFLGVDMVPSDG